MHFPQLLCLLKRALPVTSEHMPCLEAHLNNLQQNECKIHCCILVISQCASFIAMYQLPACVGNWWVILHCPFLHPWAFCCISSPLPAKEGSDRVVWGGTWYPAGAIHHHGRDTWQKKSRIDLFEKFSEESGAIFHFPSCRNTQKTKLLQLWTYLTVLSLKGKGSLSSMFQKNKLKIPQTRDILSQLSLPGSVFFLRPTYKLLKTGFTK